MSDIAPMLRDEVVFRAGSRCEYCQLSQVGQEATFHIDHVTPRAAGGKTISDNLALAGWPRRGSARLGDAGTRGATR